MFPTALSNIDKEPSRSLAQASYSGYDIVRSLVIALMGRGSHLLKFSFI